jgi:hypothetical protein
MNTARKSGQARHALALVVAAWSGSNMVTDASVGSPPAFFNIPHQFFDLRVVHAAYHFIGLAPVYRAVLGEHAP